MDTHIPDKNAKRPGTVMGSTLRSFRLGSEIVDLARVHLAKIDSTLEHLGPLDAKLTAWMNFDNSIAAAGCGGLLRVSEEMVSKWLEHGKDICGRLGVDDTAILADFKVASCCSLTRFT